MVEGDAGEGGVGERQLRDERGDVALGVGGVGVVEVAVVAGAAVERGDSAPATRCRSQTRSTFARWRTRPSSDSVDGGSARSASCSAVNPAHTLSRQDRCRASIPSRIGRSSPVIGPSVIGRVGGSAGNGDVHVTPIILTHPR